MVQYTRSLGGTSRSSSSNTQYTRSLSSTPLRKSKTTQKPEEEKKWYTSVINAIDKLSIPLYATVGAVESLTGKGDKKGFIKNVKDNIAQKQGWGSYLKKYGAGNKTAAVLGFGLDLVADPLNLLGVGLIGKAGRAAGIVAKLDDVEKLSKLKGLSKLVAKSQLAEKAGYFRKASKSISKIANIEEATTGAEKVISMSEKVAKKLSKVADVKELEQTIKLAREANTPELITKTRKALSESLNTTAKLAETKLDTAKEVLTKSLTDKQLLSKLGGGKLGKVAVTLRKGFKYDPSPATKELEKLIDAKKELADKFFVHKVNFQKTTEDMNKLIKEAKAEGDMSKAFAHEVDLANMQESFIKEAKTYEVKKRELNSKIRNETGDIRFLYDWMRGDLGREWLDNIVLKNRNSFKVVKEEKVNIPFLLSETAMNPAKVYRTLKGKKIKNLEEFKNALKSEFGITKLKTKQIGEVKNFTKVGDELLSKNRAVAKIQMAGEKMVATKAGRETLKFINDIGRGYAKVLNLFKTGKTVLNPGAHPRNIMTNVIFTAWDKRAANPLDPKWHHAMSDAIKIIIQGEKAEAGTELRKAFEYFDSIWDIRGGSLSQASEIDVLKQITEMSKHTPIKNLTQRIKKLYGSEDTAFKIAHYLFRTDPKYQAGAGVLGKLTGQGSSFLSGSEAAAKVIKESNEIYMNYAALPKFARFMRDIPFGAPFISFTYIFMNKFGRQLVTNPGAIQIPVKLKQAIAEIDPITKEEQKTIDKYKQYLKSPRYGKIPFFQKYDPLTKKHTSYLFDYFGYFPQYSLSKYNDKGIEIPIFQNPVVSIPYDLMVNKDFLGRGIIPEDATKEEKIQATSKYISQQLLPSFFPTVNKKYGVGGYFWDAMQKEKENPYGSRVKRIMSSIGLPSQTLFYWGKDKKN